MCLLKIVEVFDCRNVATSLINLTSQFRTIINNKSDNFIIIKGIFKLLSVLCFSIVTGTSNGNVYFKLWITVI